MSAATAGHMSFPTHDPYWASAADFVRSHVKDGEQVIAPPEFEEIIEHPVHSIPSGASLRGFNWAVIHKGRIEERSRTALKQIRKDWRPVFANEVFVVFSTEGGIPAIDRNSPNLRSFDEELRRRMRRELRKWSAAFAHGVRQRVVASIHALRRDTPSPPQAESTRVTAYLGDHRLITRTVWGHKILLDTRDLSLTPHLIMDGYWEMWVTKVFMETVKSGMTMADIGANVGYYSMIGASTIGPKGKIHCFEPNPKMAEILTINMEINGFIDRSIINNLAVYSESTQLEFSCREKYRGSSGIWGSGEQIGALKDDVYKITVEAVSLDDYFVPGSSVDFLKIDAEAAELAVIKGAKRLISENRNIKVIMEFIPTNLNISGSATELLDLISWHGFDIFRIEEDSSVKKIAKDELLKMPYSELLLKR